MTYRYDHQLEHPQDTPPAEHKGRWIECRTCRGLGLIPEDVDCVCKLCAHMLRRAAVETVKTLERYGAMLHVYQLKNGLELALPWCEACRDFHQCHECQGKGGYSI